MRFIKYSFILAFIFSTFSVSHALTKEVVLSELKKEEGLLKIKEKKSVVEEKVGYGIDNEIETKKESEVIIKDSSLEKAFDKIFESEALKHIEYDKASLKQKGYEIFLKKNNNTHQIENRDFNPQFNLIQGDVLYIATYGSSDLDFEAMVDSNNNIFIPKVGVINVGGLNFNEVERKISNKVQAYFIGSKTYVNLVSKTLRSVYVIGRVKSPGMITIGSGTSLIEALFKAGGILKKGSLRNIEIHKNNKIIKIDLYDMLMSGKWSPYTLTGGEKIYIPTLKSSIAILGEVLDPGIYELAEKSNLKDILSRAQGISPLGMSLVVNVYRPSESNNLVHTLTISKKDRGTFILKPYDIIHVTPRKHIAGNVFNVKGAVNYPGSYQYHPNKDTLASALAQAGGLTRERSETVFIIRKLKHSKYLTQTNQKRSLVENEVFEFQLGSKAFMHFKIKAGDSIDFPKKDPIINNSEVMILGEVNEPGRIEFKENMNLLQLLNNAEGIKKNAHVEAITVARTMEDERVWHISLPEEGTLQEKLRSVTLEPNDVITVPLKVINNILVTASGEFNKPGTYLLTKGARLSDLIVAGGGLRETAYTLGASFFRTSVAEKYNERLQELADRLEQDLLRTQNKSAAGALESQTTKNEAIFAKQAKLIEKMRSATSPGRVAMSLPEDINFLEETPTDIILEDGDAFVVPSEPSTVSIIGQVNNQNTVVYIPNYTVQDYLDQAGGITRYADAENIFIIRANGSIIPASKLAVSKRSWITGRSKVRFEGVINPGDTVYVPEDYEIKANKLEVTKDVTQIIFQILTSIGVAVAAF